MTPVWLQAVVLGVIQGLTEFLPVSSSAHLALLPQLSGWTYLGKSFDVACHFGTLLALVVYFRVEVFNLIRATVGLVVERSLTPRHASPEAVQKNYNYRKMVLLLILGSVPAAVLGLTLEDYIEQTFNSVTSIAFWLMAFAALLWAADRFSRQRRDLWNLTAGEVLGIGLAQAMALMPGVSRSGSTITAGLLLGLRREEAARFSFLLSLPVIAGAAILKGLKGAKVMVAAAHMGTLGALLSSTGLTFALGILSAGLSGFLCIHYLLRFLRSGSFLPFVVYRIGLGLALLAWVVTHTHT